MISEFGLNSQREKFKQNKMGILNWNLFLFIYYVKKLHKCDAWFPLSNDNIQTNVTDLAL